MINKNSISLTSKIVCSYLRVFTVLLGKQSIINPWIALLSSWMRKLKRVGKWANNNNNNNNDNNLNNNNNNNNNNTLIIVLTIIPRERTTCYLFVEERMKNCFLVCLSVSFQAVYNDIESVKYHFWQKLFFKHNGKRLNLYYAIMVAHGMLLITIEVKESREFQFLYVLSWTNKCLTKISGIIN